MSSDRRGSRRRRRRCCWCCWCHGDDVYCSRRRLCVLVVVAVFVALLLFSVGFVAGWYARQMQQQQSAVSPAANGIGIAGKNLIFLVCLISSEFLSRRTLVNLRFCLRAANSMIAWLMQAADVVRSLGDFIGNRNNCMFCRLNKSPGSFDV